MTNDQLRSARWFAGFGLLMTLATTAPAIAGNYAVLIGVGNYKSTEWEPVPSATLETMEFATILKSQLRQGSQQFDRVITLCDAVSADFEPTKANILRELKLVGEQMRKNDPFRARHDSLTVVLNGHGVELTENVNGVEKEGVFTFCPRDATMKNTSTIPAISTRLTVDEILDALREPDGKKRVIPEQLLLIVNACRFKPYTRNNNNLSAEAGWNWRMRASDRKPLSTEESRGIGVLYACSAQQKSYIDLTNRAKGNDKARSYFFTALKLGWDGAADATSKRPDGKVSLQEITDYLKDTVPILAKGEDGDQNPELRPLGTESVHFDSWIVNSSVPHGHIPHAKKIIWDLPNEFTSTTQRDWTGYTFIGVDFRRDTISKYIFSQCRFVNCNFESATLNRNTDIGEAKFIGCNMKGLDLRKAAAVDGLLYEGKNENEELIQWPSNIEIPPFFAKPVK